MYGQMWKDSQIESHLRLYAGNAWLRSENGGLSGSYAFSGGQEESGLVYELKWQRIILYRHSIRKATL